MTEKKLRYDLPIRLQSPNQKVHWAQTLLRNKKTRKIIRLSCMGIKKLELPVTITLTRCGKKTLDYDNCVYALKHARDVLSDILIPGQAPGQADGDSRLTWIYLQEKTLTHGLIIEIEEKKHNTS